jgi:3-dehydroquinate synthase
VINKVEHLFSDKKVCYYFDADFAYLEQIVSKDNTILITDKNVFASQSSKFSGWKTIVIEPGEQFKQQAAVDYIFEQLIAFEADRKTFIVGVGGGVVTDIAGYAASVYMRGLKFGFVPTTILSMVDASIGGKNGVDVGVYKNLVGLIRQPEFLLFDFSLLNSLPQQHWVNGFAEIIKHACIKDGVLFELLENETLENFQLDEKKLSNLVKKNVAIKTAVVVQDEFEQGDRRLLNFGHTIGHAIENNYQLLHGHAISIGMMAACSLSVTLNEFPVLDRDRVSRLIEKYQLPIHQKTDWKKIWEILKMDKKRAGKEMNFVLLNKIGEAVVYPIPMGQLQDLINQSL